MVGKTSLDWYLWRSPLMLVLRNAILCLYVIGRGHASGNPMQRAIERTGSSFLVEGTAGLKNHEAGVDHYCQGISITAGRPRA